MQQWRQLRRKSPTLHRLASAHPALTFRSPISILASQAPLVTRRARESHPKLKVRLAATSAAQPKFNSADSSEPPPTMAHRIDGTAIAKAIREKINADIHKKQESDPKYKPSLVIVQGKRSLPGFSTSC
jgi:hypothetical protein